MSGTYTEITESEMDSFLGDLGFSPAASFGDGAKEKVYDFKFSTKGGEELAIVVYSSIDQRTGVSRESGSDAIRVVLMWKDGKELTSKKWKAVGSSKRVHRIETWKKNLKKRISNWRDMTEGRCDECGAPLRVKSGKHGKFLGCARYNPSGVHSCNYTESYNG